MAEKVKLTPPMTDSKTPEWAGSRYSVHIIPANNKVQMLERSDGDWVKFSDASIALLSAYERGRAERAGEITVAEQALKDWLHVYAPDLCDAVEVEKAKARIGEHGTIAYIARALEALAPPATAIRQLLGVKG